MLFALSWMGLGLSAGGFQVNLQGTRQLGMAHCGAGLAIDASSVFFNPGSLGFSTDGDNQSRRSFSAVVSLNAVKALVGYSEPRPSTYTAGNANELPTPFGLYVSGNLSKNIVAGLGVYTPFGSTIRYEDDWKGQFLLRELSLRTIFVQPTLAYKTGRWGFGLGGVLAVGSVSLRKGVPVQFSDGEYGEVVLKGSGRGFGFNAGIHYTPTTLLSLGASFRSGVRFNADGGTATFTVPDDLTQYFPTTTFSSSINLPWTATLGGALRTSEKENAWTLALEASLVGWSVYDTLGFDFAENTDKLADSRSPREYENALIVRAGAEKPVNRWLTVRGGLYFDGTPVQAGYLTPETPDANKWGITAGASAELDSRWRLDAAFLWVEGMRREDTNLETGFSGSWKGRAFVPSFGISYAMFKLIPIVLPD
jgi:long-chain fatty acid transport protein